MHKADSDEPPATVASSQTDDDGVRAQIAHAHLLEQIVEHLPIAAVRTLFEGARGAGEALEGAAGSGLRTLKRGVDTLW